MTIKDIREKHKKEIDDFQKECKHKSISDWMPYYWAPGHSGGQVRICTRCEITIETKNELPELKFTQSTI